MSHHAKHLSKLSNSVSSAVSADVEKRGRPLVYARSDLQAEIVTRLSTGESMAAICRDESMPSVRTVQSWQSADPDFSAAVKEAKELGVYVLCDACFEIAKGEGPHTTGSIERDKLLVSVIKWLVEKREGRSLTAYHANRMTIVLPPDADGLY